MNIQGWMKDIQVRGWGAASEGAFDPERDGPVSSERGSLVGAYQELLSARSGHTWLFPIAVFHNFHRPNTQ